MATFNNSNNISGAHTLGQVFGDLKCIFYGVGTVLTLFSVVSIIVNTMILIVYIRSKTLRRVQDVLLAILSSISIYIALSLPFYMSYLGFPGYVLVNKIPCLLFSSLTQSGIMTSSIILLALGLERYFYIMRPFSVMDVSVKRLCFVSVLVFSGFTVLALLPILGYNYWNSVQFCRRDVFPEPYYKITQTIALLSVAVTTFCHLWVLKVALKHLQKITSLEENIGQVGTIRNIYPNRTLFPKRKRNAMVTVGLILVVYLICYLPHYLFAAFWKTQFSKLMEILRQVCFLCLISNSLASPLIYAKSSHRFMNRARVLFCKAQDENCLQLQDMTYNRSATLETYQNDTLET